MQRVCDVFCHLLVLNILSVAKLHKAEDRMADDLTKKGPQDRSKINIHEPWELDYWSKTLGVSKEKLKQLVQQYGTSVSTIRSKI